MSHQESNAAGSSESSLLQQIISLCIDLRLVRLIPGLGRKVTGTFCAALLSSVASILLLFFVSIFISYLIDGNLRDNTALIVTGMILMLLLRIGAEILRERSASATAGLMKKSIRSIMYRQILNLGPAYTDQNDSGSITATFVDGTEQLEQYVSYYIPYILLCMIVPAGLFIGFAWLVDLATALILLAFVPLVPIFIMFSNRKRNSDSDVWQKFKALSAYYTESLQGLPTLKLFNQHYIRADEIRKRSEVLGNAWVLRLRFGLITSFITDMVPYLGYGSALLYVCIGLSTGTMHTEQVMMVLLLGSVFYEHLTKLGEYYHNSINAKSTISSIISLIEATPEVMNPEKTGSVEIPIVQSIKFDNVSFGYEPDRPVLKNCSFSVGPGEMVALVGVSGVGKSTVIDLLFRYYNPDEGSIEVCGVPIEKIPLNFLRGLFSLVSQDTYLFYDTLGNNLKFGRHDATPSEIKNAVEISCLDGFINSLPNGFETIAGERGLRLSGGERQRIAIGRAVLKDAPFLLLDEPTASVDADSERHIRDGIKELLLGRTVLVIAHRLSTIRDATRILVMDNGTIIESGTHDELMKLNGKFAGLVKAEES